MSILGILQIIGLALSCIREAEATYQAAKSGAQKKDHATKAFADGLAAASAAGAAISEGDQAVLAPIGGDIIQAVFDFGKDLGIIKAPAGGPDS